MECSELTEKITGYAYRVYIVLTSRQTGKHVPHGTCFELNRLRRNFLDRIYKIHRISYYHVNHVFENHTVI